MLGSPSADADSSWQVFGFGRQSSHLSLQEQIIWPFGSTQATLMSRHRKTRSIQNGSGFRRSIEHRPLKWSCTRKEGKQRMPLPAALEGNYSHLISRARKKRPDWLNTQKPRPTRNDSLNLTLRQLHWATKLHSRQQVFFPMIHGVSFADSPYNLQGTGCVRQKAKKLQCPRCRCPDPPCNIYTRRVARCAIAIIF